MQDRFLFRIWDKESKEYHNGMEVFDYMRGLLNPQKYILEQCTGLKDKNGRLIYEGDIILQYGNRYKIIFSYEDVGSCGCCVPSFSGCGFVMVSVYGSRGDLDNYSELEVIGNVHENADLLELDNE